MRGTSGRHTMYSKKFKWKPLRRLKYRNGDNTDVGLYKPGCDYMHWIKVSLGECCTQFPNVYKPTQNSKYQSSDMKHVLY